jgi:hypothetical protein
VNSKKRKKRKLERDREDIRNQKKNDQTVFLVMVV